MADKLSSTKRSPKRTGPVVSKLNAADEETATQYRKMLKMGMPDIAVQHKMLVDGIPQHIIDSVSAREQPVPGGTPAAAIAAPTPAPAAPAVKYSSLPPADEDNKALKDSNKEKEQNAKGRKKKSTKSNNGGEEAEQNKFHRDPDDSRESIHAEITVAEDVSGLEYSFEDLKEMIKQLPHRKNGEPDWEECRSDEALWDKLKDMIHEKNLVIVIPTFDAIWQSHQPHDKLLDEAAACKTKFPDTGEKPRCIINEFNGNKTADGNSLEEEEKSDDNVQADVRAILHLAGMHGQSLHQAMGKAVRETKGSYYAGPTKEFKRILYKTICSHNRDACRVVDVERASGIYDSADDLGEAVRLLSENPELTIVRVKDNFTSSTYRSHYRDMKFNIMCNGLVGELQLHLRKMYHWGKTTRCVYEVDRVVNDKNYERVPPHDGGLVSVPMLRIILTDDGASFLETCRPEYFQTLINEALPSGCVYAGAYHSEGSILLCLGIKNVAALARLRDEILLESKFKKAIGAIANEPKIEIVTRHDGTKVRRIKKKRTAPLRVDIGAFVDLYATSMMKFTELTLHQEEQLRKIQDADIALILAPAGGGKTFVAVQRMLMTIQEGKIVLFVARNLPLALYVIRWLVLASRKNATVVVENVRVLVDEKDSNFAEGPRRIEVIADEDQRQWLEIGEVDGTSIDGIAVVDEAHHIANNKELRDQLRQLECEYLFLGDLSQGCTKNPFNEENVREILDLPKSRQIVVAKLAEVVRSTKRIVNGAASFQLGKASKEETETHSSSIGPALEPYLFPQVSGDRRFKTYASHVVKALKSVERNLDGVNLDDRVMIICPSDDFVESLRGSLNEELLSQMPDQQYNLVSALQSSAILPQDVFTTPAARKARPRWLVLDSIERVDGLERLIVLAVGLDNEINKTVESDFQTRSSLYRALTRAQLAVAVVNERVQNGWLEFLGIVSFDDGDYVESLERSRAATNAADDVLEASSRPNRKGLQEDISKKTSQTENHSLEGKAIQPEMEIRQNIWDTRMIAKGLKNETMPQFMPFLFQDIKAESSAGLSGFLDVNVGTKKFTGDSKVAKLKGRQSVAGDMEIHVRADGTKVRRVKKSSASLESVGEQKKSLGSFLQKGPDSGTKGDSKLAKSKGHQSLVGDGETYIRADGKKVRRVKKTKSKK